MKTSHFITVLFLLCYSYISGQTDSTISQVEKNKLKVAELKNRLTNMSTDTMEASQTLIPRLIRIENELSEVHNLLDEIHKKQIENQQNTQVERILSRLDELLDQQKTSNNIKMPKSTSKPNVLGDYYVVVESQRLLKDIQLAKAMNEIAELKILKSNKYNWYYLVLPEIMNYKDALYKINKLRRSKYSDSWYVNVNDVSGL